MRAATRLDLDAPMALWSVDGTIAPVPSALAHLSAFERARAARFHDARHRARYLAAHVALRTLVESHCGIAAPHQRYERTPLGRWKLVDARVRFSLSYAGDTALIGIADDRAIGVDLETEHPVDDAGELAALHFDASERAALRGLPTDRRNAAFLRGWTRKEACLKAIGTGLSHPPDTIATGLDGERRVIVGRRELDIGSFRLAGAIGAWARASRGQ